MKTQSVWKAPQIAIAEHGHGHDNAEHNPNEKQEQRFIHQQLNANHNDNTKRASYDIQDDEFEVNSDVAPNTKRRTVVQKST
mmetsp:Transcript_37826/g.62197  ORF Transcript_37826/g.62197 Transcript_37826/m.62197 type:complete len:82 (+) Transcript_37826:1-246(+)